MHGAWLALERALGRRSLYAKLPRPLRVALTFLGVLVTWVFFRANDLPSAVRYLSAMFGLSERQPGAALVGGFFLEPYHLLSLAAAAIVTWGFAQSWDWSRRITLPRATLAFGCILCRVWSEIPGSALGTELPCPNCGKMVKLNPFTIEADWRPVAAAWGGDEADPERH